MFYWRYIEPLRSVSYFLFKPLNVLITAAGRRCDGLLLHYLLWERLISLKHMDFYNNESHKQDGPS